MLIDTHAHINLHAFKDDADEVLQRCFAAGVAVINVGTEYNTSKQAVDMLEKYPLPSPPPEEEGKGLGVYAAIGLHPSHTYENPYLDENESASATGREEFSYEAYKQLAGNPKVVGVGECGLDYYRLPDDGTLHAEIKKQQKEAFEQQIKLAIELDKALIIHCRPSKGSNDAYDDVLSILSNLSPLTSRLRFEIHSFTGSLEIAQKFIDLGGYIGLNGIITFDKTGNMEQVVKGVPLERIVLETDSPYLAPVPYRGKRNEPVYIVEVAKKVAEWKQCDLEVVVEQTTVNARELFQLI